MKISSKILSSIIVFTILTIAIIFVFKGYIEHNYVDNKVDNAYDFYNSQAPSLDEYAEYLVDNGFIVSKQEITPYSTPDNRVCHSSKGVISVSNVQGESIYATINEQVVNDIIHSVNIVSGIFVLMIFLNMLVYFLVIHIFVIKRVNDIKEAMDEFKMCPVATNLPSNFNDELTELNLSFNELTEVIVANQNDRDQLIGALSHELKSPLSKIKAMISMNQDGIEPYSDQEYLNEKVDGLIGDMNTEITKVIEFYREKQPVEQLDVSAIFNELLTNQGVEVKFDVVEPFIISAQQISVEMILKNIITNLEKYAVSDSIVVTINNDEIMIENKINDVVETNGSKLGNKINEYLASTQGLKVTNNEDNGVYNVVISKI